MAVRLRRPFHGEALHGRHRALEYFHTSSEFLEYLLRRRLGESEMAFRPQALLDVRGELRQALGQYLSRMVELAREQPGRRSRPDLAAVGLQDSLSHGLQQLFSQTEALHATWLDRVTRDGHGDLVNSLFTSEESS